MLQSGVIFTYLLAVKLQRSAVDFNKWNKMPPFHQDALVRCPHQIAPFVLLCLFVAVY